MHPHGEKNSRMEICRKHKIVAKDSTEAELVVFSDMLVVAEQIHDFVVKESAWGRSNKSMITIVMKGGGKARNKYMAVHMEGIKERFNQQDILIHHIKTDWMLADFLKSHWQGSDSTPSVSMDHSQAPAFGQQGWIRQNDTRTADKTPESHDGSHKAETTESKAEAGETTKTELAKSLDQRRRTPKLGRREEFFVCCSHNLLF